MTPGKTYNYAFKVSKRQQGNNINKVVNWIVQSGKIESINIVTTAMDDFTISVAAIKFGNDFNGGYLKVSSDRYNVGSISSDSYSAITIPIGI